MSHTSRIFALIAAGMFSAHASAQSISMSYEGLAFGQIGGAGVSTPTLVGTVRLSGSNFNTYVGAMNWSTGSGAFHTFCTELTQTVSTSGPVVYDMVALAGAPQPGAGMGTFRAGLIQNLYDTYGSLRMNSRTESAAFQLAIWEIVHEGDTGDLNVLTGDLQVVGHAGNASHSVLNSHDGFGMSAATLANTWLANLVSVQVTTLRALVNSAHQDQIAVIPLPAPVLMAGLGLLAVPLLRRRVFRC